MVPEVKDVVVFDLDGTLTQSEEGIFACIRYALGEMGLPVPEEGVLRKFIGPPLAYSFEHFLHLSPEKTEEAVAHYRVRYNQVGLYENRVYAGIQRLLQLLHRQGKLIRVATGKPQEPARRIIQHFHLDRFIDLVVGPVDQHVPDKAELIRKALPSAYGKAWMVGDRCFDVEGGRAVGITTIGVVYGYGTREELEQAGADHVVDTVEELIALFDDGTPMPGCFLSMEGLDGSGKTTQRQLLEDGLRRYGYEVVTSREPGGSPIGEAIRQLLLDPASAGMTAETEALLYAASRAQHVRQIIRPAVAAGRVMLCDRFLDSSVAYQGGGRELGVQQVLDLNAPAVAGTMPSLTVYLQIDSRQAMERRSAASSLDRMEMESMAFHQRVQAAYEELIARDPGRFLVVDATLSPEEVGAQVLSGVLAHMERIRA